MKGLAICWFSIEKHYNWIFINLTYPVFHILKGKYVWVGGDTCEPGYTEVYENDKWTALTPYPETVTYHCATFVGDDNDRFYVLGGYNYVSQTNSDSVIEYDFTTEKYEIITKIPG